MFRSVHSVSLWCPMYCLCVNVYCHRVSTQLQLTCISYHIYLSKAEVKNAWSYSSTRPYFMTPYYLKHSDNFKFTLLKWTFFAPGPASQFQYSTCQWTGPGAHPASCKMGTGSFPGGKERPGRDADPSTPSSAVGHERVELYLYSPYGPYGQYRDSVPVQGWPLPLLVTG